ncbi:MAG: PD40 domain-containing protein [Xanthomonadales bacterium]|nr:PD40 domain-containing protein [Xanthomonadales bacterium]
MARDTRPGLLTTLAFSIAVLMPASAFAQVDYMEGLGVGDPEAYGSAANAGSFTSGSYTDCSRRVVSADGRYVVFESGASNLVANDTNGVVDVFLRDRLMGRTELISVASAGEQGSERSGSPVVSADGRYVAFVSAATNFDSVDQGQADDVFLRDREAGTTTRISVSSSGGEPDADSRAPSLSDDGLRVAFASDARNLISTTWEDRHSGVYLRDLTAQTTALVSRPREDGAVRPVANCPSLSGNGHYLAFTAHGPVSVINDGDQGEAGNLFRADLETGEVEWIDVEGSGANCAFASWMPSISSDGSRVLFFSYDASGQAPSRANLEACLVDLNAHVTRNISQYSLGDYLGYLTRLSLSSDGSLAVFTSTDREVVGDAFLWVDGEGVNQLSAPIFSGVDDPVLVNRAIGLSGDGQTLAFTYAHDGAAADGDFEGESQVGLMSLGDGISETVSIADQGMSFPGVANDAVFPADFQTSMSRGAETLIIRSWADNLVAGGQDSTSDTFVIDRKSSLTEAISEPKALHPSTPARISDSDHYLVFASQASDLVDGDINNMADVFLRDRETGTTRLVSQQADGQAGVEASDDPFVSDDGRWVAFRSKADLIDGGALDVGSGIYLRDMASDTVMRVDTKDDQRVSDSYKVYALSADGRFVLFAPGVFEPYVASPASRFRIYDRDQDLVSPAFPGGTLSDPQVGVKHVQMSSDGRFIAFITGEPQVDDDHNVADDAYMLDRGSNELTWITRNARLASYRDLLEMALSRDGRYVALTLGTRGESNNGGIHVRHDVYRFERQSGLLQRMDTDRFGRRADGFRNNVAISPDGEWVAFLGEDWGDVTQFGSPWRWQLDAGAHGTGGYLVHATAPNLSGAFYDPANSGHGWLFEQLETEDGPLLVATWYAYRDGKQLWMLGTAPIENGGASIPMTLFSGGDFPPAFDPASVATQPFGTLDIVMSDVDHGQASWTSEVDGLGSGEADFVRLSSISNSNEADQLSGCHSGSWYDPQQSGHGLQLQVIDSGDTKTAIAIWFHYLNGEPRWLLGSGPVDGDHADLAMAITHGADFPPDYDPADKVQEPWGVLRFTVNSANQAQINWDADYAGYGDGSMNLQRLTQLDGHACILN